MTSVDSCPCRILVRGRKLFQCISYQFLYLLLQNSKPSYTSLPGLCSTKYSTLFYYHHLFHSNQCSLICCSCSASLVTSLLCCLLSHAFPVFLSLVMSCLACHEVEGESFLDLTAEALDVLKWVWGKVTDPRLMLYALYLQLLKVTEPEL